MTAKASNSERHEMDSTRVFRNNRRDKQMAELLANHFRNTNIRFSFTDSAYKHGNLWSESEMNWGIENKNPEIFEDYSDNITT